MTIEECVAYLDANAPDHGIPAEHVAAAMSAALALGWTLGLGEFTPEFLRADGRLLWRFRFRPAGGGEPSLHQIVMR